MSDPVRDDVGTLTCTDTGTTAAEGVIGAARHFADGKGVFGGDMITNYPTGASSHSTEAWFHAERPNSTLIAWGNELVITRIFPCAPNPNRVLQQSLGSP